MIGCIIVSCCNMSASYTYLCSKNNSFYDGGFITFSRKPLVDIHVNAHLKLNEHSLFRPDLGRDKICTRLHIFFFL